MTAFRIPLFYGQAAVFANGYPPGFVLHVKIDIVYCPHGRVLLIQSGLHFNGKALYWQNTCVHPLVRFDQPLLDAPEITGTRKDHNER
jgi:hypothetical protein